MVTCRAPMPRPSLCAGDVQGLEQVVEVGQRLAHAHDDDVRQPLVRRAAGSAARTSCSTISPAVRLRTTPSRPLAQKTQPMPQPTCVLMQAVRRSASWISTHSIELAVVRAAASSLCVPSRRVEVRGRRAVPRRRERVGELRRAAPAAGRSSASNDVGPAGEEPAADLLDAHRRLAALGEPGAQLVRRARRAGRGGRGGVDQGKCQIRGAFRTRGGRIVACRGSLYLPNGTGREEDGWPT